MDPSLFQLPANTATRPGTYIIAEMSANHGQSLEHAIEVIHAISKTGADAVKLQTYRPDTITIDSDRPEFLIGGDSIWSGRKLYDLYAEAFTPWEWHPKLFAVAEELGLDCFSSPFDATAVDFLEELQPPAYKIASFEVVDIPLIEKVASKGRPMIMSTGMASLDEIHRAVKVIQAYGCPLALLKCTSAYPSPPSSMNLRTIPHMSDLFHVPVGLSDHTLGIAVPVAAVALGATIIEKHFTLSRSVPGPDSKFSLEPDEFTAMVDAIRTTEAALGRVHYDLTPEDAKSRIYRRSLYVIQDVKAGDLLTEENVRSIRPANGLGPHHLQRVVGRTAKQDIARGTPLAWELFE